MCLFDERHVGKIPAHSDKQGTVGDLSGITLVGDGVCTFLEARQLNQAAEGNTLTLLCVPLKSNRLVQDSPCINEDCESHNRDSLFPLKASGVPSGSGMVK